MFFVEFMKNFMIFYENFMVLVGFVCFCIEDDAKLVKNIKFS